uniref:pentapeptide repeat-containing protein n=1 Tax=Bacillus aquiflavi TaxID=2672567 RepID=UPI0035A9ADD8
MKSELNHTNFNETLIKDCNFFRGIFIGSIFKNSQIKSTKFESGYFKKVTFENVIFENIDLKDVSYEKCKFINVIFKELKNIDSIKDSVIIIDGKKICGKDVKNYFLEILT